uniref:50S ribosome-binding GTPase n=1 Tax=Candidatus Kentrum sp. LPFa TaxID=2126335 RepID=A0A450X7K2_9GAMM|nr:MAG: 50S ribosome-binding GTPase [Candidatus Kentron sp. LPFa]VFK25246.1 MAG: 50S ribosome-binding GTPase [Candidatus Kentron sp. LPFa]
MNSNLDFLQLGVTLAAIMTAIASLFAVLTVWGGTKKLPISHMVSFIGYPRSGKTTLITSLFSEIFAQRILRGVNITPRGEETIKRINEDIARLETGRDLAPTTDQDLFNYRMEMLTGRIFLSRRYKVEIGDFPGEDSQNLSDKDPDWLHSTRYFQWALNADVFLFIIDLAYLSDPESDEAKKYRSTITSSFRAAWQKIKDHHYDGARKLRNNPIVIVFTKLDLLFDLQNPDTQNKAKNLTNSPKDYNKPVPMDAKEIMGKEDQIKEYFQDIIGYLKSETNRFDMVFSSTFAREKNHDARFGMERLARSVLPG